VENETLNIKHIWSVVCGSSSIDRDSNNVSLFNVIEQISLDRSEIKNAKVKHGRSDVAVPIKVELVSLWQRDISDEKQNQPIRLEFVSPDQKPLLSYDGNLVFEAGKTRFRFRVKLDGLRFNVAGQYNFKLSLKDSTSNWVEVGSLPLEVNFVKKQS